MDGIVVLDKPAGISSFKAVQEVRRIFNVSRAGHTGTLDPMATGVLIVCLGRCTRLSRFIMHGAKSYDVTMQLGISTDTFDSEGQVTKKQAVPDTLSKDDIENVLCRFRGRILQKPPLFSALKHNGVPLYRLARNGKAVQKPAREINIFRLILQSVDMPYIRFSVDCSEGTYIRSLVHDIGHKLGCGACMTSLRRTANGIFTLHDSVTIQELRDSVEKGALDRILIAPEKALAHLASAEVSMDDAEHLRHGRPVSAGKIINTIRQPSISHKMSLFEMPYVKIETRIDGPTKFVAVVRRPLSPNEKIETLKVWI